MPLIFMILRVEMKNLIFLIFLTASCATTFEHASSHPADYCEIKYDVYTFTGWVTEYEIVPCTTARYYFTNGFYHPQYQVYVNSFYYYPRVTHHKRRRHYQDRTYRSSHRGSKYNYTRQKRYKRRRYHRRSHKRHRSHRSRR